MLKGIINVILGLYSHSDKRKAVGLKSKKRLICVMIKTEA